MKTRICQINNLKIVKSDYRGLIRQTCYQVITPDKRIWEEFDLLDDAKSFAKETKDFLRRK